MCPFNDDELKLKVREGYLLESPDEMTDGYRKAIVTQLTVQGDTELISAPAYWMAARDAPSNNTQVTVVAIIQDELAHANIAYRLLEDMGVSREKLLYEREPAQFKHPYGFDQPLEDWAEMVVANGFFDRAGYTLLSDVFSNTSYGPLKRALVKVDLEENFHLRNGRTWMKRISAAGGAAKDELQRAVDWMFPLSVEWFGLPDSLKMHSTQLEYRLKGLTNDQLRQWWLSTVVPYCEQIGIKVPAHKEVRDGKDVWELDYPFPCEFDAQAKRWDFKQPISWDDVLKRWRERGPRNTEMVAMFQEEFHKFRKTHGKNGA